MKFIVEIENKSHKIECIFKEHLIEINDAIEFYNNKYEKRQIILGEVSNYSFEIELLDKENITNQLNYRNLNNFSSYLFNKHNWKRYSSNPKHLFTFKNSIEKTVLNSIESKEENDSKINQVSIRRFKSLKDISFKLSDINLLIGANNSGKSSVLQALHFGISCFQTYQNV